MAAVGCENTGRDKLLSASVDVAFGGTRGAAFLGGAVERVFVSTQRVSDCDDDPCNELKIKLGSNFTENLELAEPVCPWQIDPQEDRRQMKD